MTQIININNDFSLSAVELEKRLMKIGALKGKKSAWIRADLTISRSWCITRIIWSLFVKYIPCLRDFFYKVNLAQSQSLLNSIGNAIQKDASLSRFESIYQQAVAKFNQIAPNHKVNDVNEDTIDQSKKITNTALKVDKHASLIFKSINWLQNSANQKALSKAIAGSSDPFTVEEFDEAVHFLQTRISSGTKEDAGYFYHSTARKNADPCSFTDSTETLMKIVESGYVKVSGAGSMGTGAYVSTTDEHQTYGPITIAFKSKIIEDLEAGFFPAPRFRSHAYRHSKYDGIWLRVAKDIPMNQKTVAFLVVDSAKDVSALRDRIKKTDMQNVSILTRRIANIVRYALDSNHLKRNCSPRWSKLEDSGMVFQENYICKDQGIAPNLSLPENARHWVG